MAQPKVEKAGYLLADVELDYARENISFKFLEQYRGNRQCRSVVMPAMKCLAGATEVSSGGH